MLRARLDLALGYGRLASYLVEIGRVKEARQQRDLAQLHYDQSLREWDALQIDPITDELSAEKRKAVEDCLDRLASGDTCD